jgi:pilus assembly protein Flp/PilA
MEEKEMEKIRKFFKDESGASLVEYALLVSLIAVAALVAITAVGTGVTNTMTTSAGSLQ